MVSGWMSYHCAADVPAISSSYTPHREHSSHTASSIHSILAILNPYSYLQVLYIPAPCPLKRLQKSHGYHLHLATLTSFTNHHDHHVGHSSLLLVLIPRVHHVGIVLLASKQTVYIDIREVLLKRLLSRPLFRRHPHCLSICVWHRWL